MKLAEEPGLRDDPSININARMTPIHEALAKQDYDAAGVLLDRFLPELEKKKSGGRIDLNKEAKLYWLELYLDLFQKLAVLALLAFLLVQRTRWRIALKSSKIPIVTRLAWGVLAVLAGVIFRGLDLSRYGDSVWAIFDIQVVLAAVTGLLTGPLWGILGGAAMALSRVMLKPGAWSGPAVVLFAALAGGLFSLGKRSFSRSGRRGFLCGLVCGLAHGCVVYLPLVHSLPPGGIIFSIGLVAFFEAVGVAVFFAVISAVLQNDLKKDMENELLKTQLLFLQAQLNPHFLFNALNTIAAVCSKAGAPTAESLTLKLSDFLRHILSRKEDQVALREELNFIDSYLTLEKARFGESLQVERHFELSESAWALKIPLLILQPLVENAIKHGLRRRTGGGILKISGRERDGHVEIEIADNGAGKDAAFFNDLLSGRTDKVEGTGVGLRNIQQRLTRIYGQEYGLIFESAPDCGTRVLIKFPFHKEGVS